MHQRFLNYLEKKKKILLIFKCPPVPNHAHKREGEGKSACSTAFTIHKQGMNVEVSV